MSFTVIAAPFWFFMTVSSMFLHTFVKPRCLNIDLLRAFLDKATAGIRIIIRDLQLNLAEWTDRKKQASRGSALI